MTSTTAFAEVIGDPIGHSKSPLIHQFWIGKLGLKFSYRATRVQRAELAAFVAERRSDPTWLGCNVTMPLKLDALMLADEASDRAVAAGAANLLVVKQGLLLAGNTDIGGLLAILGERLNDGAKDGITLLGNGGAARAALVALRMLGIDDVRIQARDLSAAYKLAVEFGLSQGPTTFDQPITTGGLINATPVGMAGMEPFAIDIGRMPRDGWVMEMVTEPTETFLLRTARQSGLETHDGLSLLVEQAAASFMLLFGHEAPREHDTELMTVLRQ